MFKGAVSKQGFTQRVGSHATKGRATGRVDIMPPHAVRSEVDSMDMASQIKLVEEQIPAVIAELQEVNKKLEKTRPFQEFQDLAERRETLKEALHALKSRGGMLKKVATSAAEESYARTFYRLAELRLSRETFKELDMEVQAVMGRSCCDYEKA